MKTLLRLHLGLGDAIICNGLVRTLVQQGYELVIPAWVHNLQSVKAMFEDKAHSITVVPVTDDAFIPEDFGARNEIAIGQYGRNFDLHRWDESFYRQARIPFLYKWEKFHVPQLDCDDEEHPERGGKSPYNTFIHDDAERGFVIKMDGYRPPKVATILDHIPALMAAKEIHCISSCFAILADLIDAPGRKVLHWYARKEPLPIFGRDWEILEKP